MISSADIEKAVEMNKLKFHIKWNDIYCTDVEGSTKKVGKMNRDNKYWMPDKLIDITGQKFGRLKVLNYEGRNAQRIQFWKCKCNCGNETIVRSSNLKSGTTKSCGCLKSDIATKRNIENATHGKSKERIYNVWAGMKSRCNYEKDDSYAHYGGRGIKVCEEWDNSFQNFNQWAMRNGYEDHLSIDRIDNDGDYEPINCRWATDLEQHNNRSDNRHITYKGETLTIADMARKHKMKYNILFRRIKRGWSVERAIEQPIKGGK